MKYEDIQDPLFRQAVEAVDTGNILLLGDLLTRHPGLINQQTHSPGGGYFENPYLIYFVADNPIRNPQLPDNVLEVITLLIENVNQHATNKKQQLDYTLGLITTGRIPRESGKQIAMMDLLIDAGATAGEGYGALAHGNIDAARHLIKRGGKYTLAAAVCFNEKDKVKELLSDANPGEVLIALTAAAFYGNAEMVSLLLEAKASPNGYPANGFHTHATPLHQAVCSGSLESVRLLVKAGANLDATDTAYNGTPLGWAIHMQTEAVTEDERNAFKKIEKYLQQQ